MVAQLLYNEAHAYYIALFISSELGMTINKPVVE